MRKSELRTELARICSAIGAPLPNDYASLTVAGLKERIAALNPQLKTKESSSKKAHNAQEFAIRYIKMVHRLRANRGDREAAAAIVAAPKFLAKNFNCHVVTQGERIWLVNAKRERVALEETNLSW